MRVSAFVALVVIGISLCNAIDGSGFNLSSLLGADGKLMKSDLKNWKELSKYVNGEVAQKRDVELGADMLFEIWYDDDDDGVYLRPHFNGGPISGTLKNGENTKVTVTVNRYNNFGKTILIFDVDANGEDMFPWNSYLSDSWNLNFVFEDLGTRYPTFTSYRYIWTYDNSGYPFLEVELSGTGDDDDDHFENIYDAKGWGITRVVFVFILDEDNRVCPHAIDKDYSLGASACIQPQENGVPKRSSVQLGQLFQFAGAGYTENDFTYSVKNCYGYDRKICQKVHDLDDYPYFDENQQKFHFDKPCVGVPSEYGCITIVDVKMKEDGECSKQTASVVIPVNNNAINSNYQKKNPKRSCRIVPAYIDFKDGNRADNLMKSYKEEKKKQCARYLGCFKTPYVHIPDLDTIVEYLKDDFEAPYTPAQCHQFCQDGGFLFSAIWDSGYQCGCLRDDNYHLIDTKRDAVPNSNCEVLCENPLSGEGAYCGETDNTMIYSLADCSKKIDAIYNFFD